MPKLTQSQRENVIARLDAGDPTSKIVAETGVSQGSVSNIRQQCRPDLPKSLGGRPKKMTETADRHALRLITSGKADTAVEVGQILADTSNTHVEPITIRRSLRRAGLYAGAKTNKPLLGRRHKKARLEFAHMYRDWTPEDWKAVMWSDETKICRLGNPGRKWVWKKKGEPPTERTTRGTMKHGGGSIMFWGCMGWKGVGNGARIEGIMNKELYLEILEDNLLESIEEWGMEAKNVIFQQDNDPKHTAKTTQAWLSNQEFRVMGWPAQSPDLNPIEHLWEHLKRKLAEYETPPRGVNELWERVAETWPTIDAEFCQKLILSMPARLEAVIQAKGGITKY